MYYELDEVAEYWHQVVKINDYQKNRFAQKIIDHFGGDLTGKRIAILGWAFKANTNDSRESPSIYVAEKLFKAGATLEIYDPMVSEKSVFNDIDFYWNSVDENIKTKILIARDLNILTKSTEIDAYAIVTEWNEFKLIDCNYSKIIFDGRNFNQNENKFSIGKN
jgi:UDPglucose 6-dehydrogenase